MMMSFTGWSFARGFHFQFSIGSTLANIDPFQSIQHKNGRLFTTCFMLFSTVSFAYAMARLGAFIDNHFSDDSIDDDSDEDEDGPRYSQEKGLRTVSLAGKISKNFDKNRDSKIDRSEFLEGVLLASGALDLADIRSINTEFDKLLASSKSGSQGSVTAEELDAAGFLVSCQPGKSRMLKVHSRK